MKDYTEKNITCTASNLYPRKNYNSKHAFKEIVLKFKELGYSYYEGKPTYGEHKIIAEILDYCKLFGAEFSKNYLRSSNFLDNYVF